MVTRLLSIGRNPTSLPFLSKAPIRTAWKYRNYPLRTNAVSPNHPRTFSRSTIYFEKIASQVEKTEKTVTGLPYENLVIGIPKEVWKNEKRYKFGARVLIITH